LPRVTGWLGGMAEGRVTAAGPLAGRLAGAEAAAKVVLKSAEEASARQTVRRDGCFMASPVNISRWHLMPPRVIHIEWNDKDRLFESGDGG